MVDLYWPRETTYTTVTPSGPETYSKGVHDVPEEKADRFRDRGWRDPDDVEDEVLLQSENSDDDVDDSADEGEDDEEELSLDEDELSVTSDDFEDDVEAEAESEDEAAESFDAEEFVDRTPQQDVIDDIETGEYDDRLDDIEDAEERTRGRRGVQNAIEERRS